MSWKVAHKEFFETIYTVKSYPMQIYKNPTISSTSLLEADSSSKTRVLDALKGREYQIGDKFLLYKKIEGNRPAIVKGEVKKIKMIKREYESLGLEKLPMKEECSHKEGLFCEICNPHLMKVKTVPNDVYRVWDTFDGEYEMGHYVKRVYNTLKSLSTVLDLESIPKYNTKGGYEKFVDKYLNKR